MSTIVRQLPAGTYSVDTVHSSFGFGIKYDFGTFRSTFEQVGAQLADGVLTGTARIESIQIDQPQFKAHVLSGDFFDAENHPEIIFRSTDLRANEDGSVEIDGELTIRGVTKQVKAIGSYAAGTDAFGSDRVSFELETTVDRREFGLGWQNPLPSGEDSLAWDVTITVDLLLIKQP
jgi:polyisoprenoid-binding protein YceI